MDSQKVNAILYKPCSYTMTLFLSQMASEAISEQLTSKKFPEGACPNTPLVLHAYAWYTSDTHVTPLLKILAMGLKMGIKHFHMVCTFII